MECAIKKKGILKMEEIKRMLQAIHKENKDILTLLCTEDEEYKIKEISDEIDEMYDKLFYGKGTTNERIKN